MTEFETTCRGAIPSCYLSRYTWYSGTCLNVGGVTHRRSPVCQALPGNRCHRSTGRSPPCSHSGRSCTGSHSAGTRSHLEGETHARAQTHTTHAHTYTHTHNIHAHTHTQVDTHTHTHTYTRKCAHTYMHTYTQKHTYTHTHAPTHLINHVLSFSVFSMHTCMWCEATQCDVLEVTTKRYM